MNTEQKLKTAEQKADAAQNAHRDAQAQLEQALAVLKSEGSEKARKAVLAAEDATRLAGTELGWAREALESARDGHDKAQRAAQLAAHEQARAACSVDTFRAQVAPLTTRLAELARESADVAAKAQLLSAQFQNAQAQLGSRAVELGLTPAPCPEFSKILAAETVLATGGSHEAALRNVFGVESAPGVDAAAQLGLAYQGREPRRVTQALSQLREAEQRRAMVVRKLLVEGSGIGSNTSPTPFDSFRGVSAECDRYRATLAGLGFQAPADEVRIDRTAAELVPVAEKAAHLIDKYLAADWARAHQALQRRSTVQQDAECKAIKAALCDLGCPSVAAALPRATFGDQSSGSVALGAF